MHLAIQRLIRPFRSHTQTIVRKYQHLTARVCARADVNHSIIIERLIRLHTKPLWIFMLPEQLARIGIYCHQGFLQHG